MPITKNAARSDIKWATVDINLADVVTAVDQAAIALPQNAEIIMGHTVTTEAWNSTSTDVLDVGDSGSQNRYLNDGNIRALGARVPLVPTGYVYTQPGNVTVRWTSGGGTPSTGKVRLEVGYIIHGRSIATQTNPV